MARISIGSMLFSLICVLLITGCFSESVILRGTVATVNDERILFPELERRRIALFPASLQDISVLSSQELHFQYRYALQQLINEHIVTQYLHKKNIVLSQEVLEGKEAEITADYPNNSFATTLLDESIHYDEWHKDLKTHLLMELFINQVIRPRVRLSPEEVEEYFVHHKTDFTLSEQWHFLQFSGDSKKNVQEAVQAFLQQKDSNAIQKQYHVTIRDILMGQERLPEGLVKQLQALSPGASSKIQEQEGTFRIFVMLQKTPARSLNPAEIYERVEHVLIESKLQDVYNAWMEKQLGKSTISIHPVLLQAYPQE